MSTTAHSPGDPIAVAFARLAAVAALFAAPRAGGAS